MIYFRVENVDLFLLIGPETVYAIDDDDDVVWNMWFKEMICWTGDLLLRNSFEVIDSYWKCYFWKLENGC